MKPVVAAGAAVADRGSEPTYEGLKLSVDDAKPVRVEVFGAYLRGIETQKKELKVSARLEFGAYLRGIETTLPRVHVRLSRRLVRSLPTRD